MADAGLDADVVLDIRQALRQIDRLEESLDRAVSGLVVTADARAVTAAIDAAIQNSDAAVEIVGEADELTGEITAAVEAADNNVIVTGDASELTGDVTAAVDAGDSNVSVTADTDQAQREVKELGDEADRAAGGASRLQAALAGIGAAAVARALFEAASAASDLEESTSKATAVFGSATPMIQTFGKEAAQNLGLSEAAALEAAGTFGNLFQALGVNQQAAAELSPEILTLAADLASFNNLGVDETLEKLRSGLVGEIEPLRGLGISFGAAEVEARAFEMGLVGAGQALTEGAKLQARWSLITEQSSIAAGDFERTSGGLANQQRILAAEFQNAVAQAGGLLLPTLLDLVAVARGDLIPGFGELAEKVFPALASILADLAPLLGTTLDILIAVAPILQVIAEVVGAIPGPVIQAAGALLLLNRSISLVNRAAQADALAPYIARIAQLLATARGGAVFSTLGASIRGLPTALRGLTSGLSGATLAATGAFVAVSMYNNMLADARAEGQAWGQSLRASFDPATASIQELEAASADLDVKIAQLQGDIDDSFLGRNGVNRDFNAALREGISEAEAFQAEINQAAAAMRAAEASAKWDPLIAQFTETGEALERVGDAAPEVAAQIGRLRVGGEATTAEFLDLALALGEAELSEEAMGDAANLLGVDVEQLAAITEEASAALDDFASTATGALPTVSDAFQNMGDDSKLSVREFVDGLNESTLSIVSFRNDLRTLAEAGFADIAGIIAKEGPEVGGALARELVGALETGNVAVLEETRAAVDNFEGEWLNTADYYRNVIGPDFILTSGLLGAGITSTFGNNLGFAERIRIAAALAKSGLSKEGQAVAAIAATEGARAARDYGTALNLDERTVEEAVRAGTAIKNNAPTGAARGAGESTGSSFAQGVAAGISNSIHFATDKAQQLVYQAKAAADRAARAQSPSRLFAELGRDMADGVALGLSEQVSEVAAEAEALVAAAAAAAAGTTIPVGVAVDASLLSGAGAAANGEVTIRIERGAVSVSFAGAVTEDEARRAGAAVADGLAERLAERTVSFAARTS